VLAYKFLRCGAIGPFSRVAWPQPRGERTGTWLRAGADGTAVCRRGVHACRLQDLPRWIGQELWAVELRGEVTETPYKLIAPEGRLLWRVEAWDGDAAARFAEACVARLRELAPLGDPLVDGYLADAEAHCLGPPAADDPPVAAAVAGVIAAEAALRVGGDAALRGEREAQVAWFGDELGLR
jgi:hypothetical protein